MDVESEITNVRAELLRLIERLARVELGQIAADSRLEAIEVREVVRAKNAERRRRKQ